MKSKKDNLLLIEAVLLMAMALLMIFGCTINRYYIFNSVQYVPDDASETFQEEITIPDGISYWGVPRVDELGRPDTFFLAKPYKAK